MKGPCRPILSVGLDPLTPLSLGGGRSSRPDSLSLSLLVLTSWTPSLLVLTPSPPHPLSLWGVRASPPDPLGLHPLDSLSLGPHPLTPSPPLPSGEGGLGVGVGVGARRRSGPWRAAVRSACRRQQPAGAREPCEPRSGVSVVSPTPGECRIRAL